MLSQLLLTDNVTYIDDTAFANCPSLTIRCYENSYVHKFCQANGVRFELVSKGVSF